MQIKSSILDRIKSGEYYPGFKVPTERELSIALGVSRNTVSAAYKELLLEGVLEARQGRGTFVKTADSNEDEVPGGRRERLVRIIDEAMAKVLELGFTVEQFAAIASIRAKEKTQSIKELRIAIVGCTTENIEHYSNQIGQIITLVDEGVVCCGFARVKSSIEPSSEIFCAAGKLKLLPIRDFTSEEHLCLIDS